MHSSVNMFVKTKFNALLVLSLKGWTGLQQQCQGAPIFKFWPRFKGCYSTFPQRSYRISFELHYPIVSALNNPMGQEPEEDRRNRQRSVDILEGIFFSFHKWRVNIYQTLRCISFDPAISVQRFNLLVCSHMRIKIESPGYLMQPWL